MCVEIKIDSLDDMCDDNYLDSKQDDIEVKIKHFIKINKGEKDEQN